MVAKSWNAGTLTFANPHLGRPDRRRRRGVMRACGVGVCGGTSLFTCLKNVVVSVPAFQSGGGLGGSGWKPAQTHFQAISGLESWNTQWHSECARVFQCSSSGSAWAASKGGRHWVWQPAGSNHTVARIRSAPPDQIRLAGFHQQVGRPASTDRGPGRRSCGLNTHPSAAT